MSYIAFVVLKIYIVSIVRRGRELLCSPAIPFLQTKSVKLWLLPNKVLNSINNLLIIRSLLSDKSGLCRSTVLDV